MDIVTQVITVKSVSTLDIGVDIDIMVLLKQHNYTYFLKPPGKFWVYKAQGLWMATNQGQKRRQRKRMRDLAVSHSYPFFVYF